MVRLGSHVLKLFLKNLLATLSTTLFWTWFPFPVTQILISVRFLDCVLSPPLLVILLDFAFDWWYSKMVFLHDFQVTSKHLAYCCCLQIHFNELPQFDIAPHTKPKITFSFFLFPSSKVSNLSALRTLWIHSEHIIVTFTLIEKICSALGQLFLCSFDTFILMLK